ncbi:putative phosphatidate phosphatase [Aphidius gifuensis]|uniref:putative phosphatidate phosphatase n=1 Tax=Aphidius gifuensis TaxID=684658 RepID=UPI001CDC67D7|nr:putative phosphatidate phosphatase [Aphidius gifuensis]
MTTSMSSGAMKIVIDFCCFLSVGIGILYLMLFTEPYERGFFCNDESIKYPFKISTISTEAAAFFAFFIPTFGMLIGEIFHGYKSTSKVNREFCKRRVPTWIVQVYQKVGLFAFGGLVTILMTETAKNSIGRLRPHFIDVCQPNIDCKNGSYEFQYKYHTNFTCQNEDRKKLWDDSRKSFLSGHSSCMMYGMVYFALYLQLRVTWKGSKLLRHSLQIICLWFSWYVAMSRISDHMHHWSDVLAGMLLGTIVALINAFCVADLFKERQCVDKDHHQRSPAEQNMSNDMTDSPIMISK